MVDLIGTAMKSVAILFFVGVFCSASICTAIAHRLGWRAELGLAIGLLPAPILTWAITWHLARRRGRAVASPSLPSTSTEQYSLGGALPDNFYD